jgi:hypothetical protein
MTNVMTSPSAISEQELVLPPDERTETSVTIQAYVETFRTPKAPSPGARQVWRDLLLKHRMSVEFLESEEDVEAGFNALMLLADAVVEERPDFPDTPEQTQERSELAEGLFEVQAESIANRE